MSREKNYDRTKEIIDNFLFEGEFADVIPYGSGHINDTYLVRFISGDVENRYILQRMNKNIFKNPEQLMHNVVAVTSYLKEMIIQKNGNPERETLNVILTKNGDNYFVDADGENWRAYMFIKGFLEGCNGRLTKNEIEMLPLGAMVMTFECGMRFLTDYLQGDTYFKIHREQHNLARCRTQFQLVKDMENKEVQMREIVKRYSSSYVK